MKTNANRRVLAGAPTDTAPPAHQHDKLRTRVPPSVRAREARARTASAAAGKPSTTHTAPTLSGAAGKQANARDGVGMLVDALWQAIRSGNPDRLRSLVDTMREDSFRLDASILESHPDVQQFVREAVPELLGAERTVDQDRALVALDLLDLGCDWNAPDGSGNRAIDLIRQAIEPSVMESVVEMRPHLRHLLQKPPG